MAYVSQFFGKISAVQNRIMSIASICVLVSCLVLTGSATLFSVNVSEMVDQVGQNNETTVYKKGG